MHLGSDAEDEQVKLKATVEYNEDMRAETNEVTNIIKISYFNVNINANNEEKIQVGDIYECLINISTNDFENDATNVILKINLPEEMEYKSVAYEGGTTPNKVVVKGNTLQINLGTIERGKNRQLTLKLNVKDLPNGVYKKDVSITGTIEADGKNAETIPTLTDTINKIGEYPFLNIPLFNQSINHLYLVSPCKAAFIPVAISVAFTALSKNESI